MHKSIELRWWSAYKQGDYLCPTWRHLKIAFRTAPGEYGVVNIKRPTVPHDFNLWHEPWNTIRDLALAGF